MDRLVLAANSFYHRDIPPEEWARRQELFRRITRDSLMVLCPPGIGPQSVRFYESLYYGRIPLLFNVGARYPMAGSIDYAAFSFTIAAEAVLRTGEIVREILAAHDRSALRERCLTACKVWNTHFSNAGRARAMAAYIHELAGLE